VDVDVRREGGGGRGRGREHSPSLLSPHPLLSLLLSSIHPHHPSVGARDVGQERRGRARAGDFPGKRWEKIW
jgi:hypothetical protein